MCTEEERQRKRERYREIEREREEVRATHIFLIPPWCNKTGGVELGVLWGYSIRKRLTLSHLGNDEEMTGCLHLAFSCYLTTLTYWFCGTRFAYYWLLCWSRYARRTVDRTWYILS